MSYYCCMMKTCTRVWILVLLLLLSSCCWPTTARALALLLDVVPHRDGGCGSRLGTGFKKLALHGRKSSLLLESREGVCSWSRSVAAHSQSPQSISGCQTSKKTLLFAMGSKKSNWDDLVDDDDEDSGSPVPPDMKYVPRNVLRQSQNFVAIREAGGKELTSDVYVRDPTSTGSSQVFWFVGKVARVSDVTLEQCVARQWPLIETHAANLRPLELFPARGSLEIWTAPGDSELDVAYNRPNIVFEKIERPASSYSAEIKNSLIGFQGEVYDRRGESGFRTWRLEDGRPAKPEVQSPAQEDLRAPTDEEMVQLQKALENKDINELYEEQQRREGKEY